MKWANIVNGEIEISNCENEIKGMELGNYYDLMEWVSMGNNLDNGFVMVKEGVVRILDEDIDLIKFRDI